MLYRDFGNTGIKISTLGFGAMRLPMQEEDGKKHINEKEAIEIIHRAFELGVNYIDTAYFYCEHESEYVVGKAIKGWRDKVYLSTKCPMHLVKEKGDYRKLLEEQLGRLGEDYIDFYHFHGINYDFFKEKMLPMGILDEAIKAKQDGLIKHISFSFHDKAENMKKIIDASNGVMESVLCQYNILDTSNQEAILYARSKGLGVIVMGPVGGGRLVEPSEVLASMPGTEIKSTPELALRFVLSNPDVCCALSGMGSMQMVEENVATASIPEPLSSTERVNVNEALERIKNLADLYCTGCGYCIPCPKNINIPAIFSIMNQHKVFKLTQLAKKRFSALGQSKNAGAHPSDCVECGKCEEKCPQNIKIIQQLKETIKELS